MKKTELIFYIDMQCSTQQVAKFNIGPKIETNERFLNDLSIKKDQVFTNEQIAFPKQSKIGPTNNFRFEI